MTDTRREQLYRTEAMVIGRLDFAETDRIFTLYTPKHGKLRAIAKGVRRPMSRMAPHLELYCRSRLMLAKGRELDVVTSAETVEAHWGLRSDLDGFGFASYLAELLSQLTQDRQENEAVYQLLVNSIRLLAEGADGFAVARHYELALLSMLGFRPEIYHCVVCERALEAEPNAFSIGLGGMLCLNCRAADPSAQPLSVNAQKYIRLLDRSGIGAAMALTPDPETAGEIERALGTFARHHAERDARSLSVLRSLREWQPDYNARGSLPSTGR